MRKTDLVKFRKIFIEQREQLLMNFTIVDEHLAVNPEDKDEADQANADVEQTIRMQLKNRETFTLKKVTEALKKIEDGTYGECESCGEEIELRRLQARPTANLCISCKEEEEKLNASMLLSGRFQYVH